jgi:hypothetical protein
VFHAFGDGAAIGSGLKVPLSGGETFCGLEDVFLGGLEIGQSFLFFGLVNFLGAGGESEKESSD